MITQERINEIIEILEKEKTYFISESLKDYELEKLTNELHNRKIMYRITEVEEMINICGLVEYDGIIIDIVSRLEPEKMRFTRAFEIMLKENKKIRNINWSEGTYLFIKDGRIYKHTEFNEQVFEENNLRMYNIFKEDSYGGYNADDVFLRNEWIVLN